MMKERVREACREFLKHSPVFKEPNVLLMGREARFELWREVTDAAVGWSPSRDCPNEYCGMEILLVPSMDPMGVRVAYEWRAT